MKQLPKSQKVLYLEDNMQNGIVKHENGNRENNRPHDRG